MNKRIELIKFIADNGGKANCGLSWRKLLKKFDIEINRANLKKASDWYRYYLRTNKIVPQTGLKCVTEGVRAINRYDSSNVIVETPKIFIFDIETAPLNAYTWGLWNQNINPLHGLQSDSFIISWAGKYLLENKMYSDRLSSNEAIEQDDRRIVQSLWDMMNEADVLIGHNIKRYDIKRMNTRFLFHGMPLPSPYQIVDTLVEAKKVFAITSNKLDYIAKFLGLGRKITTSFSLWDGCMKGKEDSLREMDKYCQQDIYTSEEVYLRLRPYMKGHVNLGLYIEDETVRCPRCLSEDLSITGTYRTNTTAYDAIRCNTCGGLSKSKTNKLKKKYRKYNLTSK